MVTKDTDSNEPFVVVVPTPDTFKYEYTRKELEQTLGYEVTDTQWYQFYWELHKFQFGYLRSTLIGVWEDAIDGKF